MSVLLCYIIILLSPTNGESCSESMEIIREEMKEMRIQREQDMKEMKEMRVQFEEMRSQIKEMRIQREQEVRIQREEKEKMKEMRIQFEEMRAQMKEMRIQREEEKQEKSHLIVKLDAMTRKVEEMEETMRKEEEEKSLERLETELLHQSPRELPVVISCAHRTRWIKPGSTITYSNLVTEFNHGGAYGGIDLDTGRFIVGPGGSGYYTVTYSGRAVLGRGEMVVIDIYRNGESVGEHGGWYSYNHNSDDVMDQGSRTVILHLDEQDYLELRTEWRTEYFSGAVYYLTFCVSLAPLPYGLTV